MDPVYISALSALGGSGIGAIASIATTWFTQNYQERSQRLTQTTARLERIFGEFIDQASRAFVDALTHGLEDPSKLVALYATIGKLKLFASPHTVTCADKVMERIVDAYYSPNVSFATRQSRDAKSQDVLREFIDACNAELKGRST